MATRVFIDGRIYTEDQAVIPVFDRGFLYGDSVYEVTRTSGGRPVDLERHLLRLARSAEAIEIRGVALPDVEKAVLDTLAAARNPESYLRIVVTRGAGEIGLDPALADRPRLVIIVRPLSPPPPEDYERGVSVRVVSVRGNLRRAVDPAVKSGNYLANVMALSEARRAGAYEGVMVNSDGHVVEGSTSNVYAVLGGVVKTPSLDCGLLDGITRRRVLELARAGGVTVDETTLTPDELRSADEVFLTSSIRCVLPVTRVDDVTVGDGRPGPVTRRLMDLYQGFLARVAAGEV